jgi:hypothetical protein
VSSRKRRKIEKFKSLFEEIMIENFPDSRRNINIISSESSVIPRRINPNRPTIRYIITKILESKYKENILKTREKQLTT